ncbi:TlpA family protein disulfide reductase [Sphingomonas crocodyli]|uniref:TlpA family protein disulfide reductase n=2 Tax=Sphingomonas crocodyli TaxID=1979270 RepID=A0A437M4Y9_9SPHN|nr:TlpA family protein disulfide reductase [Sphingomonas crocodyli]
MVFASSVRPVIACLLALSLAACDTKPAEQSQAAIPPEQVGKVDISKRGQDMPAIPFVAPGGGPATLTAFRGKPLMVNLWATWCGPCIAEMPTLEKLAGSDDRFQLIVVSQDLEGQKMVGPFFAKEKLRTLKPYLDPQNVLMQAFQTETLPTTVFFDAAGKEQWRVLGAMDWSGDKAKTLIDGAIGPAA